MATSTYAIEHNMKYKKMFRLVDANDYKNSVNDPANKLKYKEINLAYTIYLGKVLQWFLTEFDTLSDADFTDDERLVSIFDEWYKKSADPIKHIEFKSLCRYYIQLCPEHGPSDVHHKNIHKIEFFWTQLLDMLAQQTPAPAATQQMIIETILGFMVRVHGGHTLAIVNEYKDDSALIKNCPSIKETLYEIIARKYRSSCGSTNIAHVLAGASYWSFHVSMLLITAVDGNNKDSVKELKELTNNFIQTRPQQLSKLPSFRTLQYGFESYDSSSPFVITHIDRTCVVNGNSQTYTLHEAKIDGKRHIIDLVKITPRDNNGKEFEQLLWSERLALAKSRLGKTLLKDFVFIDVKRIEFAEVMQILENQPPKQTLIRCHDTVLGTSFSYTGKQLVAVKKANKRPAPLPTAAINPKRPRT